MTDIRDFIGSSIIRFDEIRKEFPQNVGLLTPISLAFWTTGSFHTNARDLCRETGIWYMNGWALSQIAKEFSLVTI